MRGFSDLWSETAGLGLAQQPTICQMLPVRAAELGIALWKPGDPVCERGTRILLGVTEWNRPDLELLDSLLRNPGDARIEIFLLADCKTQDDIAQYVPGVTPAFQPPVVGIWRDGILVERAQGAAARKLLAKR